MQCPYLQGITVVITRYYNLLNKKNNKNLSPDRFVYIAKLKPKQTFIFYLKNCFIVYTFSQTISVESIIDLENHKALIVAEIAEMESRLAELTVKNEKQTRQFEKQQLLNKAHILSLKDENETLKKSCNKKIKILHKLKINYYFNI
jgi:hypothetical protein